jgi:hypothetical protein
MGYFWRKRWQISTNIVLVVDLVGGFSGKNRRISAGKKLS